LRDIGIRLNAVTCGMTDIGPGHRTTVPTGWQHGMTDGCSSRVTGTDLAAGSNMIIDGTPTTIGITTPATAMAAAAAVDITDNSTEGLL
jgi:hypothetical protein